MTINAPQNHIMRCRIIIIASSVSPHEMDQITWD
jgi:hypothetical protein